MHFSLPRQRRFPGHSLPLWRRLNYPDLKRAIVAEGERFRADDIVIEDKSSGTQLIQDLKNDGVLNVVEYKPPPGADKVMRLHACSDRFENGRVLVPANAPWLDDYLVELTGFPGTKHDDQVELHNPGLGLPARAGSSCDLPPGLLVGFAGAAKRASDRRTASCGNGPSEERGPASLPISAMRAPISSAPFVPREASGRRSRCRKPWHRRRINAPPPGGLGARVC